MKNDPFSSKNTGKRFEALLSRVFDAYAARKEALFHKVDPPSIVVRKGGGPPRVVYLDNPFLDYCGVWTANKGRAVHVEAKSTAPDATNLRVVPEGASAEGAGISARQLRAAREWEAAGAAVAFLWCRGPDVRMIMPGMIEGRTTKSVPWHEAIIIPQGPGLVLFDFLRLLRG